MTVRRADIEFNRPAKFKLLEELGSGACGVTVRLHDDGMDADFVAKKYRPVVSKQADKALYEELFTRFRDEARILFRLNHPNIVRVFNFFDYGEEADTAYILMEYVAGAPILDYLKDNPGNAERVFEEVIDGFVHLQEREVLHRDIRPTNILVSPEGSPKIIDFGFGKRLNLGKEEEEGKSISLNWWCDTPPEFMENRYDYQTEVYFVGKLFQLAVEDYGLSDFKYRSLVRKMAEPACDRRCKDFEEVRSLVREGKFAGLEFSEEEVRAYRNFALSFSGAISSIRFDATFEGDHTKIIAGLENLRRKTMLEDVLPAPNQLLKIFIRGGFAFYNSYEFKTEVLAKFLDLFRGLSAEKRGVVVENLTGRLEASEKTFPDADDEIPF